MTFRLGALAGVTLAFLVAVACEPWDPPARMVTFELRGAHVALPCEGCHPPATSTFDDGSPAFTNEILVCGGTLQLGITNALQGCLDCHECDRKPDPNGHYFPQSCGDAGCHSDADLTWADLGGGGTVVTYPGPCSLACHGNTWDDNSPRDASHAAHLQGTNLRAAPVACEDCHPEGGLAAPTHDDGVIDLPFAGLTLTDGVKPAYDPATGTCSGTYCHGASLPEGGYVPTWNAGPDDAACGTCHGFPPGPPHTDSEYCNTCHLPTGGENEFFQDKSTHIDGVIDL